MARSDKTREDNRQENTVTRQDITQQDKTGLCKTKERQDGTLHQDKENKTDGKVRFEASLTMTHTFVYPHMSDVSVC